MIFLTSAGCDLTLGPKAKTDIVILKAGKPLRILENVTVKAKPLKTLGIEPVEQDIGGWVAMPPEHWEAIKRAIEKGKDDVR